jgi:riboflavin transporter FmnP
MREEVRTCLQLVVLSTPTTHVGVPMQQIRPQRNFFTNPISINQHLSWSQHIIPLLIGQLVIVLYLMWYNTIPSFVSMDPNMYFMYYPEIKVFDPLIFGKKRSICNWCYSIKTNATC